MTEGRPIRILVSARAAPRLQQAIAAALDGAAFELLIADGAPPGTDPDIAFNSRDVTGASTKQQLQPATQHFHDLLRRAPALRWVQTHSAGADRPVFGELMARGVAVTTASGANAAVVAQTAVAGVLALARRFPQLMQAQREKRWAPLLGPQPAPRDLGGQTAVIVGWGPVGQKIAAILTAADLRCIAVRRNATPTADGFDTVGYDELPSVLPRADWLVLACPLTPRTRGMIDAAALALLPAGAHVVNVARGEVIVEAALIAALRSKALAGAYLDVFENEPLGPESPLWALDNVIATPHSAGHSDGNERRVDEIFLSNLARWHRGEALVNRVG